ncbi:hypothetical protein ACIOMM_36650 [Streptomyces sp. NPDC087908]|uniref:hypothetical protein n=1 Tax=Streptomyces sp. NPDC087908 TaxID=3365820 RepID=UPI00381DDBB4
MSRSLKLVALTVCALAVLLFLSLFGLGRQGKAPEERIEGRACEIMDGMFRPTGVQGQANLIRHLAISSDELATVTEGRLREAALQHAVYVRLMQEQVEQGKSINGGSGKGGIPRKSQEKGMRAYDVIKEAAWNRCELSYLSPEKGP